MRERSQQEINEIGFKALVTALGREDAIRFIEQFSPGTRGRSSTTSEPEQTLPAYSPAEIHELIRGMQEPTDQAHLL